LPELVDAGASSRVGVGPAALRRVARIGAVTRTAIGASLSRLGNRPSARNNTNASLTYTTLKTRVFVSQSISHSLLTGQPQTQTHVVASSFASRTHLMQRERPRAMRVNDAR
jgi:hypothetical protein